MPHNTDILKLIPNLRAFAMSLAQDEERADDLVQETLVKALEHIDSFVEGTNLRAWLFTILRNTYFSEYRKKRREVEDVDSVHANKVAVPCGQDSHMEMIDMRRAMEHIPLEQQEALFLVGVDGMSYDEAAELAGVAIGTIKSRVNRGRIRLAELLGIDYVLEPEEDDGSVHARAIMLAAGPDDDGDD